MDVKYDDILNDVITRDYNDTHRKTAPLKPAEVALPLTQQSLILSSRLKK